MKTISSLITEVSKIRPRGKWRRAVRDYALDLLGNLWDMFLWDRDANGGPRRSDLWLEEHCCNATLLHKKLLNGAQDWHEYSWGGCAIIYNDQLAKALLTESELKRLGWKRGSNGELYGGRSEWGDGKASEQTLLDLQERALRQAVMLIGETFGFDNTELYVLQNLTLETAWARRGRLRTKPLKFYCNGE